MKQDYNEVDEKNVNEIKTFLDEHEVPYTTKYDNFCIEGKDGGRNYEIEYISSKNFPIAYPNYGIEGVEQTFFFDLSKHAIDNNSFKLWIKCFE